MTEYVELRCRSAFTFLDGATLPEELASRAAELGYHALALTDRDGVYGAPRFYRAVRKLAEEGRALQPILGAELSLADEPRPHRLTVLIENREGYRNLCRLITRSRGLADEARPPSGKVAPTLTLAEVAASSSGMIVLAGHPESALGQALGNDDRAGAERALTALLDAFGRDRLYLELGRHYDADEELRNQRMIDLARHARLPLVATNDVRYARPDDRRLYDLLTCVRHHATVDEIGRRLPKNGERWLKPPAEMARLFSDLPDALRRTREVAERCAFTLADLGYRFPRYPLPAGVGSEQDELARLTWAAAPTRFLPLTEKARAQLTRELQLIGKLGLAGYFLIVRDLVETCRQRNILVQGRGSAANSAVCYALGITAVDPVKMELLFERFLSEERGEWPDIDLDLPSGDEREEIIQYVYAKYGRRGAAMTANVITYRPKMAVRDAGRALGFSEVELACMSALLSGWGFQDPNDTLERALTRAGFPIEDERTRLLVELAGRLLNLPRHLGQHSGGMVIAEGRLDEVVPLEPASMPGRVVVQWDKDDCADLGIVKVDLLGLGMMAVLEESVALVRAHEGKEVDLAHLPPGDPEVYALLQRADTVGVFQVESRAQMATLPRMKPRTFYDLVIEVAIIRPGPIVGDLLHPYLRRRAGREVPDPIHPSLAGVLERTLGVPLFQEQLMRMAMIAAGFTGGQAEELRRAMGFKRSVARMHEIERELRAGMAKNGITGEAADRIVQSITAFALYGFPESHAASFALIVYASAWLKVHHPAAFYASLLNQWPMGFYHPSSLVRDALQRGLEVRPIDITQSHWRCTLELPAFRIGLRYVRGLGEASAQRIERARTERPFATVSDLGTRADLSRGELTALAEVGALAGLGQARRAALWQVEAIGRSGPLFDRAREELSARAERSPLREMSEREELAADYRIAGLSTGRHPIALRRAALTRQGVLTARELEGRAHGERVRVAGLVIVRQRPGTAKGFFFLTLEDESGLANAIVTPALFEAHRPLLVSAAALVLEGRLQNQDGTVTVKADRFHPLDEAGAPSHDFH